MGVAAGAASGPLSQAFNEQLLVYVLMGVAGGTAVAIFSWDGWGFFARRTILGGLLGGGLSAVSTLILKGALGFDVVTGSNSTDFIASACFVVGFAQERVGRWILVKDHVEDDDAEG